MRADHLALAAISRRQHGAFTRGQALECGFSESSIHRRLRSGRWLRLHPGVYLDPGVPRSPEQVAMAACLACGDRAVVSHGTAAALLGVDYPPPQVPEVTVPITFHPRSSRIVVHRTRSLCRDDVARARGVPVTSAMRTITDLAGRLDHTALEFLLDALWRRRSLDPMAFEAYLGSPRRLSLPGSGVLRDLVRERAGRKPAGSPLETLYLRILRRYRVPLPERQYRVVTRSGPRFIDFAYPEHRVAIELDGFDRHARDRSVFDDDRVRRNDLEGLGWTMRAFTWTQCADDPVYVAVTTAEAIGLVPGRWRSSG